MHVYVRGGPEIMASSGLAVHEEPHAVILTTQVLVAPALMLQVTKPTLIHTNVRLGHNWKPPHMRQEATVQTETTL